MQAQDVDERPEQDPRMVVLGNAQDAGLPQAGCACAACRGAERDASLRRHAACLGLIDGAGRRFLIDATPDIREQLALLAEAAEQQPDSGAERVATRLDGLVLSHAHMGHYSGLVHLGPEATNVQALPLWAMPRMAGFLAGNEPWASLLREGNLRLEPMSAGASFALGSELQATPIPVPHRDELSETVGFLIEGPRRRVLYVPDIDGWAGELDAAPDLGDWLGQVDLALVDGSFYSAGELPGRDMSKIPHPTIQGTLDMLQAQGLPAERMARLRFTHLNHSNPAHWPDSRERAAIEAAGASVAEEGWIVQL